MNPHECPATVRDCIRCLQTKPIGEYYKKAKRANGTFQYMAECKDCYGKRSAALYIKRKDAKLSKCAEYRAANKDRIAEYLRSYYVANRDEIIAKSKVYRERPDIRAAESARQKTRYETNRDEIRAKQNARNSEPEVRERNRNRSRKYYEINPTYYVAKGGERRARRVRATPKWVNLDECRVFYEQAKARSHDTGVRYVVDHIVPLKGNGVSGLHVPWNLQVITQAENLRKSNHYS